MRSHVLVYLAPAPFLVASGPMPPSAAQPRADAKSVACTAAHLAIHTAAGAPEPSPSPLPTATTQPVTTPTAALISAEKLEPVNLTLRDVDFSQITEEEVRVKAETLDKAPTAIEP